MTQGLLDFTLEIFLLVLGHAVGRVVPIMGVKPTIRGITLPVRVFPALASDASSVISVAFTLAFILTLALFFEDVKDLLAVHATESCVDYAHDLASLFVAWERNDLFVRVHINQLKVDDIVTRDVGESMVLVMQ